MACLPTSYQVTHVCSAAHFWDAESLPSSFNSLFHVSSITLDYYHTSGVVLHIGLKEDVSWFYATTNGWEPSPGNWSPFRREQITYCFFHPPARWFTPVFYRIDYTRRQYRPRMPYDLEFAALRFAARALFMPHKNGLNFRLLQKWYDGTGFPRHLLVAEEILISRFASRDFSCFLIFIMPDLAAYISSLACMQKVLYITLFMHFKFYHMSFHAWFLLPLRWLCWQISASLYDDTDMICPSYTSHFLLLSTARYSLSSIKTLSIAKNDSAWW